MKRFALLALLVLVACGSKGGPYTVDVTARNSTGDFNAITHSLGDTDGSPECTIRAFDQFGNKIGYDIFTLNVIPAGGSLPWNGHIQVNEVVASYSGEC